MKNRLAMTRLPQKADRFWFAPGAAKKAGQWRLRTSRCCNHAGLFLDRPKHRSRAIAASRALGTHAFHVQTWRRIDQTFGAVPEAWKKKINSAIATQCPDPRHPVPGTCTMQASSVDLSKTLGKATSGRQTKMR